MSRVRRLAPLPLVLLVACGPLPGLAPTAPRSIARDGVGASELVRRLAERRKQIRSFRALASMEYRGPKDRLSIREVVVVERPDHLRIEMMTAFGLALLIATDGKRVFAYHRGQKTFYEGAATAENLAKFTRLEFGVRDVANLLVGLPPPRRTMRGARAAFERSTQLWRLWQRLDGGGSRNVWFEAQRLLPVRSEELDAEGGRVWTVEWSGYQTTDGIDVPLRLVLEAPAEGARVSLDYSNASVNAPLLDAFFTLGPPAGSATVDLDTAAAEPPPAP